MPASRAMKNKMRRQTPVKSGMKSGAKKIKRSMKKAKGTY